MLIPDEPSAISKSVVVDQSCRRVSAGKVKRSASTSRAHRARSWRCSEEALRVAFLSQDRNQIADEGEKRKMTGIPSG
jgi:hypothetical protein